MRCLTGKNTAARVLSLALVLLIAAASFGCSSNIKDYGDALTLGTYKGVEVDMAEVAKQVEDQIQSALEQNAETVTVTDRKIKDGDVVNIDYVGTIDGVEFDGGTASGYDLTIGSGQFIEGFEEGLIGHKPGENVKLNLTFPEDYPNNPDMAGKKTVFDVTINHISDKIIPELNDAFVAKISKNVYNTVDEYKANLTDLFKQDTVLSKVINTSVVNTYSKKEVKKIYDKLVANHEYYAAMYGVPFRTYIESYMGQDTDTFFSQQIASAQSSLKQQMILGQIAFNEGIKYTAEDYDRISLNLAQNYGYETVKDLIKAEGSAMKTSLKENAQNTVVVEYLASQAVEINND